MSIVNSTIQQPGTVAPASQAQSSMGGADFNMFLKLLTTQMQNQDPLDPMDTSQYTQQLVQYSQVEQSMQQTGVLRDILSRLTATDMAQAAGFIGREVEFDTKLAGLTDTPAEWSYSMPREAVSLTATVIDSSGRTVATKLLEPGTDGRFAWDGALATGGTAPHGSYSLNLKALDASGNDVSAKIRSVGVVNSVSAASGNVMLSVNGVDLPSSTLVSVAARAGA
jgi:flagellar basal-body rod modification protein FlgD